MGITLITARAGGFWPLAVVSITLALQTASGAPPIELAIDECAAAELTGDECNARAGCGCGTNCANGGQAAGCVDCRSGRDACCPTMEEVTEEKSCWNVTCEKVCVPAIRMPWEPGGSRLTLFSWLRRHDNRSHCGECVADGEIGDDCFGKSAGHSYPAKCGAVRCVSVLEADSYEVTTCRCKWEIRRLPSCDANCCAGMIEAQPLEEESAADGVLPAPPR